MYIAVNGTTYCGLQYSLCVSFWREESDFWEAAEEGKKILCLTIYDKCHKTSQQSHSADKMIIILLKHVEMDYHLPNTLLGNASSDTKKE